MHVLDLVREVLPAVGINPRPAAVHVGQVEDFFAQGGKREDAREKDGVVLLDALVVAQQLDDMPVRLAIGAYFEKGEIGMARSVVEQVGVDDSNMET